MVMNKDNNTDAKIDTGRAIAVVRATGMMIAAAVLIAFLLAAPGRTASAAPSHGLSTFGDLKYPADFKHFDYVNPDAPKGGKLSLVGTGGLTTFNSFNPYILKGDAAQGLGYLFDTLMVRAYDEPDAMYGLVARTVDVAPDRSSATFNLRKEARFADGSALTAHDVVFSFNILKDKGHPSYKLSLGDVTGVEALDDHTVRYSFNAERARDLPLTVAALPIVSKAYYSTRDFAATTLEAPLGSGPYRLEKFEHGRYVVYRLREDYWAKDLPVNRGRYNFAELKYEYFRDSTAEFEALKAGEYDLREDLTARRWMTQYNIDSVKSGRLVRLTMPDGRSSGAQGFYMNLRREKFRNRKVRAALDLAFDYEWTNKNHFYSLYKRIHSFFQGTDLMAKGPPSAAELKLLEPYRDKLPASVFGEPYVPPVTNGSGQDRKLLRRAAKLLKEAGWVVKNGKRVNAKGEPFVIEFLILSPTWERVISPYLKNLKLLGIDAPVRRVDPAQFQERIKRFDFDVITQRHKLRLTPGVELRNYWGSKAASTPGSLNLSGISNPVVDALIEKVIVADTREKLNAAGRALDRVLRSEHYWVPHWYKDSHTMAFWNKFSRPKVKSSFNRGIIETWWYDPAKAKKLASGG